MLNAIKTKFSRFIKDEEGATAIEYAMIAGLIVVAIVLILTGLGTDIGATFTCIRTSLTGGTC